MHEGQPPSAVESQGKYSRIVIRMKASRHQQSKSTMTESGLVYHHDDNSESVASRDCESLNLTEGDGPLAGDTMQSVESEIEDAQ